MPFTPFHLGPAVLLKAAAGRRFSLTIFAGAQLLMDIEPLVRILRRDPVLHGASHTILGAVLIGLLAAVVGRPISQAVLRRIGIVHYAISWRVAYASALIGTLSHILLDAVMHRDMAPLWPISSANGLLRVVPVEILHILCLVSAVVGAMLAIRLRWADRDNNLR